MKTTSKPAAETIDFCGLMPAALYDLEQRLQSLEGAVHLIPVIGAEDDAPEVVAVEIELANNLVAALENLIHLALRDLELLEFELTGGAHPWAAGTGSAPSAAADGVGAA